ncbi:MAG: Rne/Rng family ribonuclease [Clostridium sp.]|uniref:Rne/Rng family ribonuclease n=1 Tax=Clostridium sp. TaxID=1506 RepID=UPI002A8C9C2F|nr:Rne/Rng family ribonuclease [Clostridium sp.]MDY5097352.1 Rne/Rng family ribonuclease [Clostridium sp.]
MREIFIEKNETLRRVAIKENGRLIECRIEEETNEPSVGDIYMGVVKNIVPAIKSAFVDIGHEKNAYMYLGDEINGYVKKGQEVLVEIIKEELNSKGAKVFPFINIPGRYVVLCNKDSDISFSQKIKDEDFKAATLQELQGLIPIGVKVRTQGENVSLDLVKQEILDLYKEYEAIERDFKFSMKPKKLYGDSSIVSKILRDCVSDDTSTIFVDSDEDYTTVERYMNRKEDMKSKLQLYEGHRNLFDYYGIEREILALRNPNVHLHCGGSLVIEHTEAMYVIDVNSGKNTKASNMENTAFMTNSEAASEIARQIRLRNLSGIIIIDFIDMNQDYHKEKIIEILEKGFRGDKNKTVIYKPTELNLVQIARKRNGKTIYDYMEEPCKVCSGHGKKLKLSYITLLIHNEVLKKDADNAVKDIYIEINSLYKEAIEEDLFTFLKEIEALDKNIYLNFVQEVEYFKVEPLIFHSQIENLKGYKVTLDNL